MREPGRTSLALRGLAVTTAMAVLATLAVAKGSDWLNSDPSITTVVPAAAGPVREQSPVQYRGVVVGKLTEVRAGTDSARLKLRVDSERIGSIPAGVKVRILPRTLFGDQYVDLSAPEVVGSQRLRPGARVAAKTGGQTVQLYAAMTRMHELLTAMRPAQFQAALSALANALRGRGDDLGRTIDQLHELSGTFDPQETADDLSGLADTGRELADSSPDLFAALDNAVALSKIVVEKRQNIRALLGAGTNLADESNRLLGGNASRAIKLVHATDPIADVLGKNSGQFLELWDSLDRLFDAGNRVFKGGRFKIRAPLSLEDPFPYTAADCPRYPGLDGPNCGQTTGGTVGPVGSPAEESKLRQITGAPGPGPEAAQSEPGSDLLSMLFGPIVRGSEVTIP